jgi:hypothetical protein
MKKWLIIFSILLNSITILLFIDLAFDSMDSMEIDLVKGGIVLSRPITFAGFGIVTLIISSIISIYYLFIFAEEDVLS